MNPQYINQQPPGQINQGSYQPPISQNYNYGSQPNSGMQGPPGQPMQPGVGTPLNNVYNGMGNMSGPPRPGLPDAGLKGSGPPPQSMQNGPQNGRGQFANRPPVPGGQWSTDGQSGPPGPPHPTMSPRRGVSPAHPNQLANQVGSMHISNQGPPRLGPTGGMSGPPAPNYTGGPPPRPGMQPGLGGMPPPTSQGSMPPRPGAGVPPRPGPMGEAPGPRMASGGPPPMSMGGMPPASTAAPPHPMSMGGMPPASAAAPPPLMSMGGMPPPPASAGMAPLRPPIGGGGAPPPPTGGGAPPPVSMYGGMPPQQQHQQQGFPPPSMPPHPSAPGPIMNAGPPSYGGNMSGPYPGGQGPPGPIPPTSGFPGIGMPPSSGAAQYGGTPPPAGPHMGMQQPPPSPGAYPGAGAAQPGYGGPRGPVPMASQPAAPRRLDPDQMPSPIQVIEDDKKNRSGVFQTGQRGVVPPLVTTDFVTEDTGNCSPSFMRSTMYNIPCTSDMMKQCHVPFAINITPFARLKQGESAMPLVDLGELGPIRCNRCKGYMCPYMLFVDGGRRFQCNFCGCNTEVPPEYFAHLDHTGRRVDAYDRPELCLGAYEFKATADYCKNNVLPKPPAYIFMIDVSYNAVKSGLVNLLCSRLKEEVLLHLPKEAFDEESEVRVGFVTYAKELHFYNLKANLAQPQMLVVSDVQDVFVPLLDGFLVKVSESEALIDSLLVQISETFAESRETELVLGPVIQAGLDALKAAECSGKLIILHTSLPVAEAPGKLKNRDDRKLLGTEKEKTILTPQGTFYTKLGQECVAAGCSVDLFLFPNAYIDVATISEVPRLTGGNVFKYSYFQADIDGNRLMEDLAEHVSKPIAFDVIMRVRTSTGIRPVDFLGNFYMANTTDVELANMDCDKAVTIEVKHDDKLSEADGAFVQAAVLYTSVSGQRRLRVLNLAFHCCAQMADLFRNCELDTLVNFMAKSAIRESMNSNPKQVRETLMTRCAHILACYRKNCASPSSAGQLILPECMKLLPLYSNCIIKNQVFQGASEVSTDDRSYLIHTLNGMAVKDSHTFFYPLLLPLHEMDLNTTAMPTPIRCSYERLKDSGVYLIENGLTMLLWIGMNVNPEWVFALFGVQSAAQIDIDKTKLQDLDNPISRRVRDAIRDIQESRHRHLKLTVVRQRDKLEPVFQQHLVEDRSASGSASYVDFLCHIHKEIRTLLS